MCACNPSIRRQTPEVHWPASLAYIAGVGFSQRPCLSEIRLGTIEKVARCPALALGYVYKGTCT